MANGGRFAASLRPPSRNVGDPAVTCSNRPADKGSPCQPDRRHALNEAAPLPASPQDRQVIRPRESAFPDERPESFC